ncbi:ser thr phosphatase family superfamily protein [Stylonychia lemnae]|uniref:Ser thr phosphatase family superfamily protein n=1 Tax=Stylonychia lemnae TaxID=5949 RepID=A0A078AB20_STYLE|nr:ser thr phosphatase family superfamily protein [Stylonychia lemnae]|eukprot:CDW79475.1 ser thr phosphatase family superfamily protein [Stylonychia lemnae]
MAITKFLTIAFILLGTALSKNPFKRDNKTEPKNNTIPDNQTIPVNDSASGNNTKNQNKTLPKELLKFNKNGKFKIIQFTDTHFGELAERDQNSQELMKKIMDYEKADLVVVSGDMVSGYAWDGSKGWYEHHYRQFLQPMIDKNMKWAVTAGNHDDEVDITKEEMSELDRSHDLSYTLPNSGNISKVFNYLLPIYDQSGKNIMYRLWFLDSGNLHCQNFDGYDCFEQDQIDWFRSENSKIKDDDISKGRAIAIFHIPLYQFMHLLKPGNHFYGYQQEPVCCQGLDTGLFAAIKEQKSVEWITCGHDHNNDYHGTYDDINLSYGRKTGYGGYGPKNIQRGARIFEITLEPYSVKTWIREENGNIVNHTQPHSYPSFWPAQHKCCLAKVMGQVTANYEENKKQHLLQEFYD